MSETTISFVVEHLGDSVRLTATDGLNSTWMEVNVYTPVSWRQAAIMLRTLSDKILHDRCT